MGSPLGGLINVESERPSPQTGGYVAVRGGSFSTFDPYLDLNAPLAPGVAARLVTEYQTNDSWIDRVGGDRWSVQPSVAFQLGAHTDLLLQAKYDRRSQLEYSGFPAPQALAGQLDRDAFPGATSDQPHTTIDNREVTATLRHAFSDDVRLTRRYYDRLSHDNGSFVYPDLAPPVPATATVYPIFSGSC